MKNSNTTKDTAKRYNGHYNYETFLVSLWIDNDPNLYQLAHHCGKNNLDFEMFKSIIKPQKGDWEIDIKDWDNPAINVEEINEKLQEFNNPNY